MTVGAEQRLTGNAEALSMDLMGDAIAGGGEQDTEPRRGGLEEPVVIGVLEIRLQDIVIDITNRQFGFYARDLQRFERQIGHGTGGVLGQGLVDA